MLQSTEGEQLSAADTFYRAALIALTEAKVPFLVGGAFALRHYTRIHRDTKDLDLFLARSDLPAALGALEAAGYRTEMPFPHWLAKSYGGDNFVDLIFNSGNGACPVDPGWFDNAATAPLLGVDVRVCAVEEMIWTKAFVMERERYDGADIAHLLQERGDAVDWNHLLQRFGPHWRVLYAHLVLYGFIYSAERKQVPNWVMQELAARIQNEGAAEKDDRVCYGTLISREQYLLDVQERGYADARVQPHGRLKAQELEAWTAAIGSGH
jgi:hypothetical protein